MSLSALKQFNWVDIFVVIIVIRILYVAIKTGLSAELFKLLGTVSAIYFACHYYSGLSDSLRMFVGALPFLLKLLDILSFLALAALTYSIFIVLRNILYRFMKLEATPKLNKWGGFILGTVRSILAAGLVMLILVISQVGYLAHSVRNAYSGECLLRAATGTYSFLWNGIISKFAADSKINSAIIDIQAGYIRK